MSLHIHELRPETDRGEIIDTSPTTRLVVARWDAPSGRSLVAITPQYQDRYGEWRLAHSAVSFPAADAAKVAAVVLQVAADINADETRMP